MWGVEVPPKIKTFMWLLLRDRLLVRERIARLRLISDRSNNNHCVKIRWKTLVTFLSIAWRSNWFGIRLLRARRLPLFALNLFSGFSNIGFALTYHLEESWLSIMLTEWFGMLRTVVCFNKRLLMSTPTLNVSLLCFLVGERALGDVAPLIAAISRCPSYVSSLPQCFSPPFISLWVPFPLARLRSTLMNLLMAPTAKVELGEFFLMIRVHPSSILETDCPKFNYPSPLGRVFSFLRHLVGQERPSLFLILTL